jgi:hypothetical protein
MTGLLGKLIKKERIKNMSFEKPRRLDNTGHEYNYHKFTRFIFDSVNDHLNIEFYGYKDEESKLSGCDPKSYPMNFKPETIHYEVHVLDDKGNPVLDGDPIFNEEGEPVLDENGEQVKENLQPVMREVSEVIPNPILETIVNYNGEDLKIRDLFKRIIYTQLKNSPQFEGAKDI